MFFYLKNLRAQDAHLTQNPASLPVTPLPEWENKAQFKEWCGEASTDHIFYSLIEGDVPSQRVSQDNPPRLVHGVVADYDAKVDWTNFPAVFLQAHHATANQFKVPGHADVPPVVEVLQLGHELGQGAVPLLLVEVHGAGLLREVFHQFHDHRARGRRVRSRRTAPLCSRCWRVTPAGREANRLRMAAARRR